MPSRLVACFGLVIFLSGLLCGPLAARQASGPPLAMTLDVDATDAPMKILHATLSMPARPGAHDAVLSEVDSGRAHAVRADRQSHGTARLRRRRGTRVAPRPRRDERVRVHRPRGRAHAHRQIRLRRAVRAAARSVHCRRPMPRSRSSTGTPSGSIRWATIPASITVTATLKTPAGWKHGGSLDVASVDGTDDPLRADVARDAERPSGARSASTSAASCSGRPVRRPASTSSTSSPTASGRCSFRSRASTSTSSIVLEERAVFGNVGHYRKYHWLLTLSDNLGAFGVEHHECADDRVAENTFVDDGAAKRSSLLLPHEFFHSWNGKARRPAGLVQGGYEQPMKDDLLWVYEGLTNVLRRTAGGARGPDHRAKNGWTKSPPTRWA